MILGPDHKKMSKSKGNVIDPDKVIEEFGADALRMYEMFMGPIDADKPWNTNGVVGIGRFLNRVYKLVSESVQERRNSKFEIRNSKQAPNSNPKTQNQTENLKVQQKLHQTLKKVSEDIPELKFNTAIASMMELVNEWESLTRNSKIQIPNDKQKSNFKNQISKTALSLDDVGRFVRILAVFAPFLAEELWQELKLKGLKAEKHKSFESVHLQEWPKWDEELAREDEVEIAVQVNGKLRSTLKVGVVVAEDKDKVIEMAKADEKLQSWIQGKEIRKEIFVPGRLVNLVV
jgi:leucyl-tRNA synthetase